MKAEEEKSRLTALCRSPRCIWNKTGFTTINEMLWYGYIMWN